MERVEDAEEKAARFTGLGPLTQKTTTNGIDVTSKLDVVVTDVELVWEEATRDFVVEYGLLKFNVVEEVIILVAAMD